MSARESARSGGSTSSGFAAAERRYRLLLRAYPSAFRVRYEREMAQLFADQWREGGRGGLLFWTNVIWDLVRSAPPLRVEAWRARGRRTTRTLGDTMKLVAVLTVLFGTFGAISAVAEGVIVARQGSLGTAYTLSVVLSVVAGALLLAAGFAALRGTPSGRLTANRAAIASLVLFVLARLVLGWMSIFAQLAGILFPLAALAALRRPVQRGSAA